MMPVVRLRRSLLHGGSLRQRSRLYSSHSVFPYASHQINGNPVGLHGKADLCSRASSLSTSEGEQVRQQVGMGHWRQRSRMRRLLQVRVQDIG